MVVHLDSYSEGRPLSVILGRTRSSIKQVMLLWTRGCQEVETTHPKGLRPCPWMPISSAVVVVLLAL
eukprot:9190938-Pyramimonas_sp.AAC.1